MRSTASWRAPAQSRCSKRCRARAVIAAKRAGYCSQPSRMAPAMRDASSAAMSGSDMQGSPERTGFTIRWRVWRRRARR
ncbi:hypothetical protein G6F46_015777 [Rhizopus delemar]|nr:hypothetical protein G6F46_015777 [Rhizopus delemar]